MKKPPKFVLSRTLLENGKYRLTAKQIVTFYKFYRLNNIRGCNTVYLSNYLLSHKFTSMSNTVPTSNNQPTANSPPPPLPAHARKEETTPACH